MATTQTPRRLSSERRRAQLEEAALASVAAHGSTGFSIEDVAERAGVTRNLIYHYFPRGRQDLLLAAIERSGRELTEGFITDTDVPLAERQRLNFESFIAHASKPSDAWRVLVDSGIAVDPELRAAGAGFRDRIVAAMAQNHFGTDKPSPVVAVALRAYLRFAETAFEEAREAGLSREQMLDLADRVLIATVKAARALESG